MLEEGEPKLFKAFRRTAGKDVSLVFEQGIPADLRQCGKWNQIPGGPF